MEYGNKFWEIIDELKKEQISEGGRDKIRKLGEQVKTVHTCPLPGTMESW